MKFSLSDSQEKLLTVNGAKVFYLKIAPFLRVNRQTKFQKKFKNEKVHTNPKKSSVSVKNGEKLASLAQFEFTVYLAKNPKI